MTWATVTSVSTPIHTLHMEEYPLQIWMVWVSHISTGLTKPDPINPNPVLSPFCVESLVLRLSNPAQIIYSTPTFWYFYHDWLGFRSI